MTGTAMADAIVRSPFVDATRIVPHLAVDIRYAGSHNFTGGQVTSYEAPRCWLTRAAASALAVAQADLVPRGLGLKVFDCYRPVRAVRHFIDWSKTPDERGKREFFPNVAKRDLFRFGYIAERSSHSRGSTVDLTLIERSTGAELDMGTPFDFFDPRSHPDAPNMSHDVDGNRAALRAAMQRAGFVPYDKEWWHFTLKDEPYPETSFDVPIR